jgi:AraC-like DNA-binding protein
MELAPWIMHYWLVNWDLPAGVRQTVETLPHPNIQLVFTSCDPVSILVHGVHTSKFTRTLEGRACVFGVKFAAGGFRPFCNHPVAALRGKTVNATRIFGPEIERLAPMLVSDQLEEEKIAAANRFFLNRIPASNADATLAALLVNLILTTPEIHTVNELAAHAGASERSLQRLFHEYVGATPKWVIRRYRMHELVERLNSGARLDWASVAADLGYFDQSHLIRDFRRLTGYTPEQYRRREP